MISRVASFEKFLISFQKKFTFSNQTKFFQLRMEFCHKEKEVATHEKIMVSIKINDELHLFF